MTMTHHCNDCYAMCTCYGCSMVCLHTWLVLCVCCLHLLETARLCFRFRLSLMQLCAVCALRLCHSLCSCRGSVLLWWLWLWLWRAARVSCVDVSACFQPAPFLQATSKTYFWFHGARAS
jgi:hypothetical protein